jgi:PAS domain S-box-containing protein
VSQPGNLLPGGPVHGGPVHGGPGDRSAGAPLPASAARARVWVVDDSPLQTERATQLLSPHYVLDVFLDGGSLLERLSEADLPDLILLDWQMPGVSGLEVCQFLRERYDEVTLPILMLTARGERRDFIEGLSAGANDYVAKPYDDAELLARVRGLVRTRQLARAMREREEWFATTLRSIGDAVIATDENARVTFFNRAAEELTGWRAADALARTIDEVFVTRDEQGLPRPTVLERLLQPGAQASAQALLVRKDGSHLPIDDNLGPIGPDGALGTVVTFRDAGARTRAAAEAAQRADFEEKLIGIVSHDLRNPLNVIALGTDALSRMTLEPRAVKTILRIRASADSATRLVNDLLDFTQARLGSGIPVRREPVDLCQVVQNVLDELMPAHPERTVKAVTSGDAHGEWDADRIAQALTNLASNALNYGAATGTVTVHMIGEPDCVTLAVHNTGTPIPPLLLPVLFEPLRRGTARVDKSGRSVGLGLYIVKHIVDAHGGTLSVQSSASEGTTFSLRLPRHVPASARGD